jgi:hypothetical protein
MANTQYADLLKMQLVRVVGHIIGPEHDVIVVVKNTMDNLNLTYRVSVTDFLSSRFEEVQA